MLRNNLDQWYEYNTSFAEKLHGKYPNEQLNEYLQTTSTNSLISNRQNSEWDELPMDLDSQLKLEFALYLINESANGSLSTKGTTFLQKLGSVDVDTLKELVQLVLENDKSLANKSTDEDEGKVEQITSYLISSSISKGINLASIDNSSNEEGVHDPISFCKKNIDILLDAYPQNSSSSLQHAPLSTSELELNDISKQQDLQTAITDLQLAYKFLKSKYENDRDEYQATIETLNKTNKELSEELLHYHSKLKEREEKSKVTSQMQSIPMDIDRSFSQAISESSDIKSSTSASNHQSFSMMKQEFKRILADTQLRYEKELEQERLLRQQLENKLENKGYR